MSLLKKYFNLWRQVIEFRKYDTWCENNNEELSEQLFAQENNMDPIYWCWNCKYSNCEKH